MATRAKFKVERVDRKDDACNVELRAVTEHDADNEAFWKYTPAGHLQMYITNPAAFEQFQTGQVYYIDLTLAG